MIVASARILKRAWQVYVAHVFLFAIYMAEISYVSTSFENPRCPCIRAAQTRAMPPEATGAMIS